ncbi:hypothetical protein V5799_016108 [Amblyomma americanum]|uniref:Uncharacterized protein n=1 Tax=Amblyomma americanum TaxID=6943 RepID=A0AAQ4F6P5_AMBAM
MAFAEHGPETFAEPGPVRAVGAPNPSPQPVPRAAAPVIGKELGPLSPKSFEQDDPFVPKPAAFRKSLQSKEDRRTQGEARNRVRMFFLVAGTLIAAALLSLLTFLASLVFFDGDTKPPYANSDEPTTQPWDRDNGSLTHDGADRKSGREGRDTLSEDLGSICADLSCSAAVSLLRAQLDFRYDPCWNLYDHVCSQWQSEHCDAAAERGGSYSVDDVVVDRYAQMLGKLLIAEKGQSSVVPDERQFLVDCLDGKLSDAEEVWRVIHTDILENSTSTPEDALAEVIVRMARVGVSPFFDIHVDQSDDVFVVKLSRPHVTGNNVFRMTESIPALLEPQPDVTEGSEASDAKSDSKPFFLALQRQLCLAIAATVHVNKSCRLSPSSRITPAWNYTWYSTEGLKILSAASVLEPLASRNDSAVNRYSSASMLPLTGRYHRMDICTHTIDRYVPNWLLNLSNSLFPKKFRNHVNQSLSSLKELIADEMPSARNIKMVFVSAPLNQTKETALSSQVSTSDAFTNDSRLEAYLKNWTWKRWIQGPDGGLPALSSTKSTFLEEVQTLHVPLGAFNWSNTDSPLLRYLELARAGPRVLSTLFLERLSEEFKDSRLVRCLASHLGEAQALPEGLDLEEVASFYFSLTAYRSHIATELAISPFSSMMTDALFLLYYAFNNCEAVCQPDGSASSPRARRRKVDAVARVFSSELLQECNTLPNVLSGCGYSSEDFSK